MAGLASMMGFGGGMPSPEEMAKLAEQMPGGLPADCRRRPARRRIAARDARPAAEIARPAGAGGPKLPGLGGLPPDFPGLGKKK